MLLDAPTRYWRCPSCPTVDQTQRSDVHTQFHDCPALGGLNIPLVEVRSPDDAPKARQRSVQSEYGHETAAVLTERMDGSNDCTVFPQPARMTVS
jgi:hypothetical protein